MGHEYLQRSDILKSDEDKQVASKSWSRHGSVQVGRGHGMQRHVVRRWSDCTVRRYIDNLRCTEYEIVFMGIIMPMEGYADGRLTYANIKRGLYRKTSIQKVS